MRARVEYAICIDVNNREINIVPHDNTLKTIYNYLGCRTFDVVRIDDVNSIYIDDEGLFVEDQRYFTYEGDTDTVTLAGNGLILGVDDEGLFVEDQLYFKYTGTTDSVSLAGNGLILGVDDEGETIEPTLTLEHVKSKVSFLPLSFKIEPSMSFTVWN